MKVKRVQCGAVTAVLMWVKIFWNMALLPLVNSHRRSGAAWRLCIQVSFGRRRVDSEDGGINLRDVGYCFYSSELCNFIYKKPVFLFSDC